RLMALWGGALGDAGGAAEFAVSADRVRSSFEKAFWNPQRGHLDDVVGDPSLRPNPLFALSLPYPLLSPEQRKSAVRSVQRTLATMHASAVARRCSAPSRRSSLEALQPRPGVSVS